MIHLPFESGWLFGFEFVDCVDSRKYTLGYISFYWGIYPRDAVCRL